MTTNDTPTPTPRTEAAQLLASFNESEAPHYPRHFMAVSADFARTLERELIAAQGRVRELEAGLRTVIVRVESLQDSPRSLLFNLTGDLPQFRTLLNQPRKE